MQTIEWKLRTSLMSTIDFAGEVEVAETATEKEIEAAILANVTNRLADSPFLVKRKKEQ